MIADNGCTITNKTASQPPNLKVKIISHNVLTPIVSQNGPGKTGPTVIERLWVRSLPSCGNELCNAKVARHMRWFSILHRALPSLSAQCAVLYNVGTPCYENCVDMKCPMNSTLLWFAVGCCATFAACSRSGPHQHEATGPTLDVPRFSIAVKLSHAADNRLRSMGEAIKVIAYFDGDPLPGQGKYNPPMRDVYLGMAEKPVNDRNEAQFEDVRIPQRDWNRLSDKNYFVTINTVSARKVARDNLLDCADPISVKIDAMKGKTTEVHCWLIGEARAPTHVDQ